MSYLPIEVEEFLRESNKIEGEGEDALQDSFDAWQYIRDLNALSEKNVRELHYILMRSRATLSPEDKGVWTRYQTSVGGRNNPEPWKVPALMEAWTYDINLLENTPTPGMFDWTDEKREVDARRFHVRFEHIHPFLDGNGRVGRILYQWHRLRMGLPIHVIKYEDRKAYYEWF